jgi:PAS domain S-box-containing protein
MEVALRESEDHYRNSVELNPQIPWTSDADGMILTAGPRWEMVTGLTLNQTLNEGWVKALHPDDVEPTVQRWVASLQSGLPVDVEFRVGRGDGVWRWMRSRAAARRDSDGKIIRWYGTVEDVDDRKKTEQALRESEALLRAVFDAVPVGLVIAESPGSRIIMSNPRAEAIFGRTITPDENMNAYRQNAFHPDGRRLGPEEYPTVRAMSSGGSTLPEDMLYVRGDGTQTWIRASATPVQGKNGAIAGAVLAIQDIDQATQEKQRLLDRIAELKHQLNIRP